MLMQELSARGFTCHALETSPPAHQLIWALSARYGHQIDLHDAPAAEWQQRFPLVMAFEVLEHIEDDHAALRSEEQTSELQSLMRISYAVFCLNTHNYTTP